MRHWTWWLGLGLGGLLVIGSIAETIRAIDSGDGGLWFWTPTLVGGGALVIAGTLVQQNSPAVGRRLLTAGAVVAMLPTLWTVVIPVLLVVLIVANAKQVNARAGSSPPPGSGTSV